LVSVTFTNENYQAYSPVLPVGTQHQYKSSFDALATIFRAERFGGLVRGIDAAILRTAMGSSVREQSENHIKSLSFLTHTGTTSELQFHKKSTHQERLVTCGQHLDLSRQQFCLGCMRSM
jgi:hypothetical protein